MPVPAGNRRRHRCDGSTIVGCSGGRVGRLDCAALFDGMTCRIDESGAALCDPVSEECDNDTPEQCNDGVITYCDLGRVETVDCRTYGLSGCTLDDSSGQPVARCTE